MKSLRTTLIAAILTTVLSINAADGFCINDEYIDDIPFNTEKIYNEIISNEMIVVFDFEDEKYIDDIPFETSKVILAINFKNAINKVFFHQEESYIDDIPFSTEKIKEQVAYEDAMNIEFNFEEEHFINDFNIDLANFETCKIFF